MLTNSLSTTVDRSVMRIIIAAILLLLLASCGAASAPITERLNGTWANELVIYKFDFAANTVSLTALGKTNTKPFTIESQDDQTLVLRTDGMPLTIRLIDAQTATITQPGKIPLSVKRQ